MKTDDLKSIQEVWEWKERANAKIKDLPTAEQLNAIRESTRKIREWVEAQKAKKKGQVA
ncbi:MAG: hypothetical protein WD077_03480 [Bacteroidia bacterium]